MGPPSCPLVHHPAATAAVTTCAPLAGDQYTVPPWKTCSHPPPASPQPSSEVGNPAGPVSQPCVPHQSRIAPHTTRAPPAALEYTEPTWKCWKHPESGSPHVVSVTG